MKILIKTLLEMTLLMKGKGSLKIVFSMGHGNLIEVDILVQMTSSSRYLVLLKGSASKSS
jgi:hypothetical protein